MATNTALLTAPHLIVLSVIIVSVEATLVDAHLTLDTPLRVSFY